MPTYNKFSFLGGLTQQLDATKAPWDSTYRLLINGRPRRGTIKPVRAAVEITATLPTTGNVQGLYSFDTYLLVFIDGAAYYKKFAPEEANWHKVNGLLLDATVPKVYVEPVPASTVNFERAASDDTDATAGVKLSSPSAPSPQCLVVTDGKTQPWVMFSDGTARITQTYAQWTTSNREYVPIMKFPMFSNGILYGVMADARGKFTQIVRSVSGRPLDFMVVINAAGDKVSSVEKDNGALATATSVSFEELTALGTINGVDGAFLATTLRQSTLVIPDYTRLIYGEHQWRHQFLFNVGAVSDDAIADLLGDTAVVYPGGIRTFNGVTQSKFEGRNAPLSAALYDLLGTTRQITSAAVEFDNYVGFGVQTVHGPGIVWYDTILSAFVAFDPTTKEGAVKQFAAVVQPTTQRLFFLTESGRVYEAFAGATQPVSLTLQALPAQADEFQAVRKVIARFIRSRAAGYAQTSVYSDGRLALSNAVEIPAGDVAYDAAVIPLPESQAVADRDSTVARFEPDGDFAGRNLVQLTWDADAELLDLTVHTDTAGNSQQNPEVTETADIREIKVVFVGCDAVVSDARTALNDAMQREDADYYIHLGNVSADGTATSLETVAAPYWGNILALTPKKLYAIPGADDLAAPNAEPLFNYFLLPPPRYYKLTLGAFAEIYMLNAGFDAAGVQTESDNTPNFATGMQAQWLSAQIASSSARHKFIAVHNAPRTSAATQYPGKSDVNALSLAGVSAIFSGDARFYERLVGQDDGIPRFVVGTGGQTPLAGTNSAIHTDSQKIVNDNFGYLVANIGPLAVEFTFKDLNGNVRDRYRI
jgi:hypothetical protein